MVLLSNNVSHTCKLIQEISVFKGIESTLRIRTSTSLDYIWIDYEHIGVYTKQIYLNMQFCNKQSIDCAWL